MSRLNITAIGTDCGLQPNCPSKRIPPRPCEKAMFKSLCGSGPEARLGLLAVLIFARRGAQAALIAWMSGCTPRMAIVRFRLYART